MNSSEAWSLAIERGDTARRLEQYPAAEQAYLEAEALAEPGSLPRAETLIRLGRIYEHQGRTREAEKQFRLALRIYESTVGDEFFDLELGRDLTAHRG
jgi:tetratricopeptide (TPR) repeat protein